MPEMSGLEACRAIREFSSVPVLFLTAKTQEPDKNDAYDTGEMISSASHLNRVN